MARRGRFELPRVEPTGLAIQRDGQAMRTSQQPFHHHFSFKPNGLLTLLHHQPQVRLQAQHPLRQ